MSGSKHICQVAFSALDARALRFWYRDVFGFIESGATLFFPPSTTRVQGVHNALETCRWLVDRQDYFQLEFFRFLNPKSKPRPAGWKPSDIGYTTLGIHVAEFDKTLARLAQTGSKTLTAPAGAVGERRVCTRDPEGNVVEIFEKDPFPDATTLVRPELNAIARSLVVSVPDLEKARGYFHDALGLTEVEGATLHEPVHEELWGLKGAVCRRLLMKSDNFFIELVQYTDPAPAPWPEGYRISDQGFMNFAIGYRDTPAFDTDFKEIVGKGARPNGKPVDIGVFKVMYVNSQEGFSVELLYSRKPFWSLTGFSPQYAYVENEIVIDAPPEKVWAVLSEHDRMGDWCLFKGKQIKEGSPDPRGKGARRVMRGLGMKILEEVNDWTPPRRFGYTVLKGGGVKKYQGDLVLTPEGGATRLRWSIRFRSKTPGGGKPAAWLLKKIFASAVKRLKAKVEQAG